MPIISVRDNENNRWKKNEKKKTNKTRLTEDTVKGWELIKIKKNHSKISQY